MSEDDPSAGPRRQGGSGGASCRALNEAVGARVAELRQLFRLTQDDLARAAQRVGFSWGSSSVAELELGRRNLDAEELFGLPAIFTEALERSIAANQVALGPGDYVFNLGFLFMPLMEG